MTRIKRTPVEIVMEELPIEKKIAAKLYQDACSVGWDIIEVKNEFTKVYNMATTKGGKKNKERNTKKEINHLLNELKSTMEELNKALKIIVSNKHFTADIRTLPFLPY